MNLSECLNPNCTCINGECYTNYPEDKCDCFDGWTGIECNTPICNPSCVNGICNTPGVCTCNTGWTGILCNEPICSPSCINGDCIAWNMCNCSDCYYGDYCQNFNKTCELCQIGNECVFNCSLNCGVNGECVVTEFNEQCNCLDGWTGSSCNTPICNPSCVNGVCNTPGVCTCNTGWTGNLCDIPTCSPECVYGSCTAPYTCTCITGYQGSTCLQPICTCGLHGTCVAPDVCKCEDGWYGDLCENECDGSTPVELCYEPLLYYNATNCVDNARRCHNPPCDWKTCPNQLLNHLK